MPKQPEVDFESLIQAAHDLFTEADSPHRGLLGFFRGQRARRDADALAATVGRELVKAVTGGKPGTTNPLRAAEQEANVGGRYAQHLLDQIHPDVREKQEYTFEHLRNFAKNCAPVTAIIGTRKEHIGAFAKPAVLEGEIVTEPGFRIRMTKKGEEATDEDRRQMADIQQFILEGGFTAPPEDERSDNWQPGFSHFLNQFMDDSLTLDWAVVRTWGTGIEEMRDKFPLVAFEAVDAARIRRTRRPEVGVEGGRVLTTDWNGERKNNNAQIRYVEYAEDGDHIVAEYTAAEMFHWVRLPVTDWKANGYGRGELELSIQLIEDFMAGHRYNAERFHRDMLPRGFFSFLAQVGDAKLAAFRENLKAMMQGNRWSVPIFEGNPTPAASITWNPIDLSQRDMEYANWMHFVALWIHANYKISMEETGYAEMNQQASPLSEASPIHKLQYSRDKGLRGLLEGLGQLLNRALVWRLVPSRRYTLEFVGLGEYDATAEEERVGLQLQNGTTTPELEWIRRDKPIPPHLKNDPAMKMPGTYAQNAALVQSAQNQMAQQQQQEAQNGVQQQQAAQQGAHEDERMDMERDKHEAHMEGHEQTMDLGIQQMRAGAQANQPGGAPGEKGPAMPFGKPGSKPTA